MKGKNKKIEKVTKPKRNYKKQLNLLSMSTSTNLEESMELRRK